MEKEISTHNLQTEKAALLPNPPTDVPSLYTRWPKPVSLLLTFRSKFILTIEPVLFLFMFGIYIRTSVLQQYIFYRYGQDMYKEELNYSGPFNFCMNVETLDQDLGNGTGNYVSERTSYLSLAIGITSQLPGIFAALIYGPLSDRVGRKPIMIVIPCASCLSAILILLLMYLEWPVELLAGIVTINGLVGGLPGMLTVVYSYVADVSSKRWLTVRIGIMEAMIYASGSLALLISGQWLKASECSFQDPFFLYLFASLMIIPYVLLWLPESVSSDRRNEKLQNRSASNLFRVVSRGFRLFLLKEYSRWRLWLCTVAMFFAYLIALGAANVNILFLVNYPLHWLPDLIGLFQAMSEAVHGLCLIILLPILVALRVPDGVIMFVAFVWAGVSLVAIGLVQQTWQMFLVGVIQGVEVLGGPPIRSIISKVVAPQDQGALFSIVAAVQVIASVCASVIFFFLFPWIILVQKWPAGYIYFFIAAFCVVVLPIAVLLLIYRKGPGAIYTPNQPTDETDGASVEVIDHRSKEFETSHITDLIISSPPPSSNALYYGSTTTPVDYSETLSGTYLAKRSNKA